MKRMKKLRTTSSKSVGRNHIESTRPRERTTASRGNASRPQSTGGEQGFVSKDFWAKTLHDPIRGKVPGISVYEHCLNVGWVARALRNFLPPPVRALVPLGAIPLSALHDLGKISPGFQRKCPGWL